MLLFGFMVSKAYHRSTGLTRKFLAKGSRGAGGIPQLTPRPESGLLCAVSAYESAQTHAG
jgi:hypothetical protein